MAVFRVERTRDYTVMCNHHLKDSNLSLKAKGLLSMMLSLPDEWNYTTRGLATICKEGVDAIGKTLKELELAGYIIRRQLRGKDGRISDTEYTIFEKPRKPSPPDTTLPDTENPYLDKRALYERYLMGEIDLNTYKAEKAACDELLLKTKNAYAAVLAQAKQKQDEQARQDSRKEASKAIFDADTLTTELAELLIDRVLVYPDKRIEIAYKIQDIFD